jgi:hypothetical protein
LINHASFLADSVTVKGQIRGGLQHWPEERGYLRDHCIAAQEQFRQYMDYFRIGYQ